MKGTAQKESERRVEKHTQQFSKGNGGRGGGVPTERLLKGGASKRILGSLLVF